MAQTRAEAKIEAAEEKEQFSNPNAAREAGAAFWNTSEEKDVFGNVRARIKKVSDASVVTSTEATTDAAVEEGGAAAGTVAAEDLFSFQGSAPGTGSGVAVKEKDAQKKAGKVQEEKAEEENEEVRAEEKEEEAQGMDGVPDTENYDSEDERQRRLVIVTSQSKAMLCVVSRVDDKSHRPFNPLR